MPDEIAENNEAETLTPIQELMIACMEERPADVATLVEAILLEKIDAIVEDRRTHVAATMFLPDLAEEDLEESEEEDEESDDESGNGAED